MGLMVDRPTWDFGTLGQKQSVEATFQITNRDTQPIRIRAVLKDCDCSAVDLPKNQLQPGESVSARVSWDTRERRGRSSTGVRILYAKVSEPVDTRELNLELVAQVKPDFAFRPMSLEFDLDGLSDQSAQLELVPDADPRARIKSVVSTHPAVQVELISDRMIRVTFDPATWREAAVVTGPPLCLETTSANEPRHFVKIKLVQSPDLAAAGNP